MLDIHGVFLYSNHMTNLARQIQLKLKKFDELMTKLKIKYNDGSNKDEPTNSVNHLDNVYGDLHKLDEKIQEIHKLIDNNK
jgi:hypothetical protein